MGSIGREMTLLWTKVCFISFSRLYAQALTAVSPSMQCALLDLFVIILPFIWMQVKLQTTDSQLIVMLTLYLPKIYQWQKVFTVQPFTFRQMKFIFVNNCDSAVKMTNSSFTRTGQFIWCNSFIWSTCGKCGTWSLI